MSISTFQIISLDELTRIRGDRVVEKSWLPEIDVAIPEIAYGQTHQPEYPIWEWPPSNWTVPSYSIANGTHYIIKDAIVHTENGVITVDQYCVRESLYLVFPEAIGWAKPSENEISIPATHGRRVEEAYHSLCGYVGNRNYAHWWIDVVPLLGHQIVRRCFGDAMALIPKIRTRYQENTLALMPEIQAYHLEVQEHENVVVGNLHYVPSVTGGDYHPQPWNLDFIKELKRRIGLQNGIRGTRRIYLSRRDASARKMIDEDIICSIASAHGFEVIETSGLTLTDQIRIFSHASHVISPHGAGLANMLFCSPGTRILELHVDNCINWSLRRLAAACGHSYGCLIGRQVERYAGQSDQEAEENGWTLPLDKFVNVISSKPYI